MKQIFHHFLDILLVSVMYIGQIGFPLFIILNIANVCSFNNGLIDLIAIFISVVMFLACRAGTREARHSHNKGNRFLF
jgi:hypothetical protein